MAKPYVEPKMRQTPPMEDAEASDEHMGAMPEGDAEEEAGEKPSAFLSSDFLEGKSYEPGDEIILVVKSVDPETGEAQVECSPKMYKEEEPEPKDSMAAMDQAFPES